MAKTITFTRDMDETTRATLVDAVLDNLTDRYVVDDETVEGESVSFLLKSLRDQGWTTRRVNAGDWIGVVESLGFRVADGRNRRGQRTQVVCL